MWTKAPLYMLAQCRVFIIAEAQKLLQLNGSILMNFPEVDHVLPKIGRADTPTAQRLSLCSQPSLFLKPAIGMEGAHTLYLPPGRHGGSFPV